MPRDPDVQYEKLQEEVDLGIRCPGCWLTSCVQKRAAIGVKPFRCSCCGCEWAAWRDPVASVARVAA